MLSTKNFHEGIHLPAIRTIQNGQVLCSTTLTPAQLRAVEVDRWEYESDDVDGDPNEQGYQRAEEPVRYRRIARYLAEDPKAMLPTAALLSVRGNATFTPISEGSEIGYLDIPPESLPMYIVDAQHRRRGLLYAIDELQKLHLRNFNLPAVIMVDVDKLSEVKQFLTINNNAKKIPTDLALRQSVRLAAHDPITRAEIVGKKREWQIQAVDVVNNLNTRPDSPWFERIQRPNESKQGNVMINESSMVSSLKPVLTLPWVAKVMPTDEVTHLVNDYWNVVMTFVKSAKDFPRDYAIQKTTGAYVMHIVAPTVFEMCRNRGERVPTPQSMYKVLEPAATDYLNDKFWQKGGDAGIFSSSTGFQRLASQIQDELLP